MSNDIPRTVTAYHEAGHAVAHVIHSIPITLVVVCDDQESRETESLGYVRRCEEHMASLGNIEGWKYDLNEDLDDSAGDRHIFITKLVTGMLSGAAAEEIQFGTEPDWWGSAESDKDKAIDWLELLTGGDLDAVGPEFNRLYQAALELLREHWDSVEAVAQAVDARGRLSTDQVTELMASSGR